MATSLISTHQEPVFEFSDNKIHKSYLDCRRLEAVAFGKLPSPWMPDNKVPSKPLRAATNFHRR